MTEHMTIQYIQVERQMTSHLNGESMLKSMIPHLFDLKEVLMEDEKNKTELSHIKKVVANTVGRVLGDELEQVKVLRKFLPLVYDHPNSDKTNEPALVFIQKPEALQETVNAEMVEYLVQVQMKFLLDEVAEGAENKAEFLKDMKLATDEEGGEVREDAEERIKREVVQHGVWIGHGDLLTMKMFYVAKSLR